jgi:hypothetical protein
MLDLSAAYNRYRFLGDEFLTWVWFLVETKQETFRSVDPDCTTLEIGSRMVLENRRGKSVERISIRGDEAGLEEGKLALTKGALITELSLVFKTGEHEWSFSIKGESLNVSSLKTPGPSQPQSQEEMEVFLIDRAGQLHKIMLFIQNLYRTFIHARVAGTWTSKAVPSITKWVNSTEPV